MTALDVIDRYDAGLLGDGGGGNVEWWQDYLRVELDRAHDFYAHQIEQLHLDLAQHKGNASEVIRLQNANDSLRAALQEIRTLEERHTVCVARKIASEALAGGAVDPNLYAGAKL